MTDAELKELVASLAQEHARTERSIGEMRAGIREIAANADRRNRELDTKLAETATQIREIAANADRRNRELEAKLAETATQIREMAANADKERRELNAQMKQLQKQLGEMGNIQGDVAEDLFRRNFASLLQERGILLNHIETHLKYFRGYEYDLVGVNGELVIVMEVKNKLNNQHIDRFLEEQLPAFRDQFATFKDRGLVGAVGSLVVAPDVEAYAEAQGLFVFTQKGEEGAQIVNRPNFRPKVIGSST